jgi:DNA-binding IclR family transcriptional regulator
VVAAVSVAGTLDRLEPGDEGRLPKLVAEAAERISESMGFRLRFAGAV